MKCIILCYRGGGVGGMYVQLRYNITVTIINNSNSNNNNITNILVAIIILLLLLILLLVVKQTTHRIIIIIIIINIIISEANVHLVELREFFLSLKYKFINKIKADINRLSY